MKSNITIQRRQKEAGIALLISIFILLLIGVVAIALAVSSGTESALAGNYRSSTNVYYAAVAGLEEVRGRLRANNPNSFSSTAPPGFLPPPGTTFPIGSISYVLNPGPNENIGNILTTYPDTEYDAEFGASALNNANNAGNVQTTASIWNRAPLNGLNVPGPVYKWVRINPVSEVSLKLNVSPFNDPNDAVTPIFYDGTQLNVSNSGQQVFEITSLAVLPPNGITQQPSQKLLQYLVVRLPMTTLPPFLSALTISGSTGGGNPVFQAPANNTVYSIKGDDYDCSGNPTGSKFVAIGLFGDYSGGSYAGDLSNMVGGIPTTPPTVQQNYTGVNSAPDVEYLNTYPANMQTPAELDMMVQAISQNADVILPGGSTGSSLTPLGMSTNKPLTIVVNGDLDVTSWTGTGYGLLLVTGKFTYDPATTWNGIVLVIGEGQIDNREHGQYKQMNGAVFVARTRDAAGNLLTGRIGGGSVSFDALMQGNGIRYSSCWIQRALPISGYKILSFHEIAQ